MQTFFVEIKCRLGKTYAGRERARRPGDRLRDLLHGGQLRHPGQVPHRRRVDIGHFVAENVQTIAEIQDTKTIITFKAF
jgi:hypothetical protein